MIADNNNMTMYSDNSFGDIVSFAREDQARKLIDVVYAITDRG